MNTFPLEVFDFGVSLSGIMSIWFMNALNPLPDRLWVIRLSRSKVKGVSYLDSG